MVVDLCAVPTKTEAEKGPSLSFGRSKQKLKIIENNRKYIINSKFTIKYKDCKSNFIPVNCCQCPLPDIFQNMICMVVLIKCNILYFVVDRSKMRYSRNQALVW